MLFLYVLSSRYQFAPLDLRFVLALPFRDRNHNDFFFEQIWFSCCPHVQCVGSDLEILNFVLIKNPTCGIALNRFPDLEFDSALPCGPIISFADFPNLGHDVISKDFTNASALRCLCRVFHGDVGVSIKSVGENVKRHESECMHNLFQWESN